MEFIIINISAIMCTYINVLSSIELTRTKSKTLALWMVRILVTVEDTRMQKGDWSVPGGGRRRVALVGQQKCNCCLRREWTNWSLLGIEKELLSSFLFWYDDRGLYIIVLIAYRMYLSHTHTHLTRHWPFSPKSPATCQWTKIREKTEKTSEKPRTHS